MSTGLTRTQFWTLGGVNPIPRTGLTARAESRTDVEGYLLPADSARTAALVNPGVADGLQVEAAVGDTGATVLPGIALNGTGRVIVLAVGGRAVVDPTVGAGGVQNIPTVPVPASGVTLDTTVPDGDYVVTVTWREVEDVDAGLLVLRLAPWLRLTEAGPFADDGLQLPLALVSVAGGTITGLAAGPRRMAGLRSGGLELRRPSVNASVGQTAAIDLVARDDGGAQLRLLSAGGAPRTALAVSGATADVDIGAGLTLGGGVVAGGGIRAAGTVEATGDLTTAANLTAQGDLAVQGAASVGGPLTTGDVTTGGRLTVAGTLRVSGATKLGASLDVAGPLTAGAATFANTVDVAGPLTATGAATFANKVDVAGPLTATGAATFASTVDVAGGIGVSGIGTLDSLSVHGGATIGAGGDAVLRTRHVFGKQGGSDGDDDLFLNWSTGRAVRIGGGQPANLVVSGRVGVHTNAPTFDLQVIGTICANTFCNPSDARTKSEITDLVDVSARLSRVRSVTFVRRGGGTGRRQAGVLAQDLVGAFPELVVPMEDDEGHMAVDYAGLAGVLVGAVNELRAANAALERRIGELEHAPAGGPDAAAG